MRKISLPGDKIQDLYVEGRSLREIAKLFNCTYPVVRKRLAEMGIEIRKWQRIGLIRVPNSQEKLAYLAGIIDGEGSVDFIINKKRLREKVAPRVRVGNTDKKLISWLESEIGGYVGYTSPPTGRNKPCYEWVITGEENIKPLLHAILPYLIIKRENAEEILKFYEK